jgi:hypothetical protein
MTSVPDPEYTISYSNLNILKHLVLSKARLFCRLKDIEQRMAIDEILNEINRIIEVSAPKGT